MTVDVLSVRGGFGTSPIFGGVMPRQFIYTHPWRIYSMSETAERDPEAQEAQEMQDEVAEEEVTDDASEEDPSDDGGDGEASDDAAED